MVTKEELKETIEEQLAKWKSAMEGLKASLEHAEADAKIKLHGQLESLHDKRVKAEKLLEELSVTSQDVWEQVKAGAEQAWSDLTRTAKSTMDKVRQAMAKPKRDEEIRSIAYDLWLSEGRPDGRQSEHWLKAEAIWQERQTQTTQAAEPAPARPQRLRKKPATPTKAKSRATPNPSRRGKKSATDNKAPSRDI